MFTTRNQKRKFLSTLRTIFGIILGITLAIPFIWMIVCAFQESTSDIYAVPPKIPNLTNIANLTYFLQRDDFMHQLGNTLILVIANMIIGIGASIIVAYGFARFKARGKKVAFTLLLSTMMLPWVVTMVPAYMIFAKLGMVNTLWPLILPSIGGSAYNIFLLRQFFQGIPRELDEAAKIDGCNSWQVLIHVLLPNCLPIIATMVIFSFIGTWSDYVGPSIYLYQDNFTLALGLQNMTTVGAGESVQWHKVLGGCFMYALPMIVVYMTCQKAFVRGAVGSAIK